MAVYRAFVREYILEVFSVIDQYGVEVLHTICGFTSRVVSVRRYIGETTGRATRTIPLRIMILLQ